MIPISYNLRSLAVRWPSTLLAVFSVAATVAVLAGMLALQQGFADSRYLGHCRSPGPGLFGTNAGGDVLATQREGQGAAQLGLRHAQQRRPLPVDPDHVALCVRLDAAVHIDDVGRVAEDAFQRPAEGLLPLVVRTVDLRHDR